MKYITTKENPIFKEGIEFEKIKDSINSTGTWVNVMDGLHKVSPIILDQWLKKCYIKEAEEKEFTKSDMIEFARDFERGFHSYEAAFDKWLKQRDK